MPDTRTGLLCRHLPSPPPAAYVCVPLAAQGETLGILYLTAPGAPVGAADGAGPAADREGAARGAVTDVTAHLARTVGDNISLAIANLRLREMLHTQSIRDPLTGVFNRRYLEETLGRELCRAERAGRPLGVILGDIDHFKQFNDTYGHEAGDALLRELGHVLRDGFRQEDIVCRYGGEEFVIVLPDAPLDDTVARAEHLRQAVTHLSVSHHGRSLGSVSISLGVAIFPAHGATSSALIHAADVALYRAKQNGRGCVEVAA